MLRRDFDACGWQVGYSAFVHQILHDLQLDLLDFGESLPLPRDQVIDLLVQIPDFRARP